MDFKGPMGVGDIHYNFAKPAKFDVEAEKERILKSAVERPNKATSEYEVRYRSYASYLARHMHAKGIAERDNLVDAAGHLVGALMLDLRTDFSLPCKLIAEEHFLYDSIFTRI
ncbi:hypothetical protein FQP82_05715 [Weissella cibaria]|uniref:hypothetical protein n=1 Tax=Weissella cibaria TaxID=137591 RepID=UPI0011954569|nr:hypothetical protein [Weissella cibaria]TVV19196.1 hypothetical protein FQP82_05715 [Weissella cibaria]